MRIAQICADSGIAPGSTKGAAQHLRGIAAGFSNLGHDVTTFSARRAEGAFPVEVVGIQELGRDSVPNECAPDVVYERYSLGHLGGLEHARRTGSKFVLEVNAPLCDEAETHRPGTVEPQHREIERQLLAEADVVVTVSCDLTRWATGFRSGPTVTIPNGFEPSWFTESARPDRRSDQLVFLGHPKPWHGADRLPRLLYELGLRGLRPELVVIGGGPGVDKIVSTAQDLEVSDQLVITGPLPPDQASRCLRDATIGLAPYRRQTPFYFCPLKVIDYLASGLPVVASDQGDIAELAGDGALLVDPDSDEALANGVAELLTDPSLRQQLGDAGRRRAWSTMTWDQVAARTLESSVA